MLLTNVISINVIKKFFKIQRGLLPQRAKKKKFSYLNSDPCANHRMSIYSEMLIFTHLMPPMGNH